MRWESHHWHFEPPVKSWLGTITSGDALEDEVMRTLAEFATHDLGALGIGALLVYSPGDADAFSMQQRLPPPPPLDIRAPVHLAPLRHVLSQIDGAAVFDAGGVLRHLGAQLVPSREAEAAVQSWRGTRHTSALRFSFDNPAVTVFTVSEDGPVSVMRGGAVVGRSSRPHPDPGPHGPMR
jgi:DNA integrity scanning protein DisA with diadenylate cyclase activity